MSSATSAPREPVPVVGDYPVTWPMPTRWNDNDMFGHLNNAVYYAMFDSALNAWLARDAGAQPMTDEAFAVLAESSCRFISEVAYPANLVVGLRVERIGSSSATFGTALWPQGYADDEPVSAYGRWVHVYIDRETRRPVPIPAQPLALYERAAQAGRTA